MGLKVWLCPDVPGKLSAWRGGVESRIGGEVRLPPRRSASMRVRYASSSGAHGFQLVRERVSPHEGDDYIRRTLATPQGKSGAG